MTGAPSASASKRYIAWSETTNTPPVSSTANELSMISPGERDCRGDADVVGSTSPTMPCGRHEPDSPAQSGISAIRQSVGGTSAEVVGRATSVRTSLAGVGDDLDRAVGGRRRRRGHGCRDRSTHRRTGRSAGWLRSSRCRGRAARELAMTASVVGSSDCSMLRSAAVGHSPTMRPLGVERSGRALLDAVERRGDDRDVRPRGPGPV